MKKFSKIYIEITNKCNMNCSFCTKISRKDKVMTVEEFEMVVRDASKFTSLIALHVKGEPLLHPNLKEILSISEKYNLKVNITTNATLLLKQLDTILSFPSIRQINISLHSAEQSGIDEDVYITNIFKAVDDICNKTNIIISYRLWNLENLKNNKINQNILLKLGNKYNIENIIEKAQKNEFIELDRSVFLNQDIEFEWPDINREIISKTGKCYGLRNQIGILSNGDVVPCCLDADANIFLGNIFEQSLEEILTSNRAKDIVSGFERHELVEELCQKCGFINTRLCK